MSKITYYIQKKVTNKKDSEYVKIIVYQMRQLIQHGFYLVSGFTKKSSLLV